MTVGRYHPRAGRSEDDRVMATLAEMIADKRAEIRGRRAFLDGLKVGAILSVAPMTKGTK